LIWSFISFRVTPSSAPDGDAVPASKPKLEMRASQNITNLIRYKKILGDTGYGDVVHLVAFGGWNGPHLPAGYSGAELYRAFHAFNTQPRNESTPAATEESFLWDGFDWDLEGHDDLLRPTNVFTKECLDQMGEMSALARTNGYVVSMAPPESYLDTTRSEFSRSVKGTYPEPWHREFTYHGANVYAYILAKWGDAIDFVFLQFYESYSHGAYRVNEEGVRPDEFLVEYVDDLVKKGERYLVNFEDDASVGLENQFVDLPLDKLVFGFANGWAGGGGEKVFFAAEGEIEAAYEALESRGRAPRGMGYWVISNEGDRGIFLTRALNKVLKTRSVLDQGVQLD